MGGFSKINKMSITWNIEKTAADLADTLATNVHTQIEKSIAEQGSAVLALSGGSTPKPFFKALAAKTLDWSKVVITLVDERWVDESHELSNALFLHENLLQHLSDEVSFVPLYHPALSLEESFDTVIKTYCERTGSSVRQPRKLDIVILGMGGDGHTASFFPDASNIASLVDANDSSFLATCDSPSTQVPRITWTLNTLLNTSFLALHFTGCSKRQVFEQALVAGAHTELPIRSAIFQDMVPLNIYYAD